MRADQLEQGQVEQKARDVVREHHESGAGLRRCGHGLNKTDEPGREKKEREALINGDGGRNAVVIAADSRVVDEGVGAVCRAGGEGTREALSSTHSHEKRALRGEHSVLVNGLLEAFDGVALPVVAVQHEEPPVERIQLSHHGLLDLIQRLAARVVAGEGGRGPINDA